MRGFAVGPDPCRAESIANEAVASIDPFRILAIIIHYVFGVDIMPVPERPVISTYIFDVRNDILCKEDAVLGTQRLACAIRHADFRNKCNMRRTIACELNLLRLDENR